MLSTNSTTVINYIGKILITKELQSIIDRLHSSIPGKEWSGVLFYSLTGNVKSKKNLSLKANFFYPLDIGSSVYTEWEATPEIMDAYEVYPDGMESLTGHMHTHHTMSAYFSGTDTQELIDNAGNYNFYVSLVVNCAGKYVCKIAFPNTQVVQSTITKTYKDASGNPYTVRVNESKEIKSADIYDLEVVFEQVPQVNKDWLDEQITKLKSKPLPVVNKKIPYSYSNYGYGNYMDDYDESLFANYSTPKVHKKSKEESFLLDLISCSDFVSLENAIKSFSTASKSDIAQLESYIDTNFEIDYFNTYGAGGISKQNIHKCVGVLVELDAKCGDSEIYEILMTILTAYL